ncbi:MAG: uracil-DNA glycosylase family protein [bacterium]|nr:uracil-DNA glycosylase family protein [bacterium]
MKRALKTLLADVRACTICAAALPHGVRPVVQVDDAARVLIAGQAPGRRVHESGVPFDDPSGERLRDWMGVTRAEFYDPKQVAILPMGFCYPGTGKSGDLPPRPECAPAWRAPLLDQLRNVELTLILGRWAMQYHLDDAPRTVTEAVLNWKKNWPTVVALPHPSPRNQSWMKKNPWFEEELLPKLRRRVRRALRKGL